MLSPTPEWHFPDYRLYGLTAEEIVYVWKGLIKKYIPDFIIRLTDGSHLILETKGQDDQQNRTKREFLDEWVRAVNGHGGFGVWKWAVSKNPADLVGIIEGAIVSPNGKQ